MAIGCKDLSFSFTDKAGVTKQILKDFSFTLDTNEIKLIYGHIGAGKSTLLYLLAGLLEDIEGEVFWDDFSFNKPSAKLDRIRSNYLSVNFSNFYYIKDMNVEDNISFPAIFSNKSKEYITQRLERLYETFSNIKLSDSEVFNLKSFSKSKIGKMSNGQREIVMLARTLMLDTPYILADEMLRSFNTNVKKQIIEILFEKFRLGSDNSLLLITHDDAMHSYMKEYSHKDVTIKAYDFINKGLKERV